MWKLVPLVYIQMSLSLKGGVHLAHPDILRLVQLIFAYAPEEKKAYKVSKDIPVTGRGCCERLRLPHFLDKRLIDGG
jgi:hypothetical protein